MLRCQPPYRTVRFKSFHGILLGLQFGWDVGSIRFPLFLCPAAAPSPIFSGPLSQRMAAYLPPGVMICLSARITLRRQREVNLMPSASAEVVNHVEQSGAATIFELVMHETMDHTIDRPWHAHGSVLPISRFQRGLMRRFTSSSR